jgi:hypothetical protein
MDLHKARTKTRRRSSKQTFSIRDRGERSGELTRVFGVIHLPQGVHGEGKC